MWPEDFIIDPDPALPPIPGTGTPRPPAAADVLIIAALPDPTGSDRGAESVTLLNVSATTLDLTGWALSDAAGGHQPLAGHLAAGATLSVLLGASVQLANQGDSIRLANAEGAITDQVAFQRNQVRAGRTIAFGR